MGRRSPFAFAAALFAAAFPAVTAAQVGVETDASSRYLWRGVDLGAGPVVQPSVWGSIGGLTLSVWGSAGPGDDGRFRLSEVDPSAAYAAEWAGFSFEPTFVCYLFPGEDDPFGNAELVLRAARPLGPVEAFTEHSIDVIGYPGSYFGVVGLGAGHEFAGGLALSGSASAGWATSRFNEVNLGVPKAALNVAEAGADLTWTPAGILYLRPHAGLSLLLDRELAGAAGSAINWSAGLAVGREF
ncbi:hypothetical protein FJY71_04490 [candidate division WOR-3 bacterium]|nr:hypothetical protein [candidate division WOR-3 bacterium]